MKPTLKAPGTERLKLTHNKLLSRFASNFKLRHYSGGHRLGGVQESDHDFPLNASNASLLALGILHQAAPRTYCSPRHQNVL